MSLEPFGIIKSVKMMSNGLFIEVSSCFACS